MYANYFLSILSSPRYIRLVSSVQPSFATRPPLSSFPPLHCSRSSLARLLFLESLHFPSWPMEERALHPILSAFGRRSSISLDFKALKQVSKSRPRKNSAPSLSFLLLVLLLRRKPLLYRLFSSSLPSLSSPSPPPPSLTNNAIHLSR